jgi:hypothetical protein
MEKDEDKMNIDEMNDKDIKDINTNNMAIDDEINEKNAFIVIRKKSIIKKVLQSFEFRNNTKEDKSKDKVKDKIINNKIKKKSFS